MSQNWTVPFAAEIRRLFLIVAVGLAAWLIGDVLLLTFAAILVAIALHGAAGFVVRSTRLSPRASLVTVSLGIVLLLALAGVLSGPQLADQGNQLWDQLIATAGRGRHWLEQFAWGRTLFQRVTSAQAAPDGSEIAVVLGNILSKVTGILGALVVVAFTGFFFAAAPSLYVRGAVTLVPPMRRERVGEVFESIGEALRSWMFGQSISMLIVAVAVYIGLTLLGIPLAPLLAIIAGLTNLAPYIGPFVGAAPSVLVAFGVGPEHALWVALLFFAIQFVEGNLLQPVIQNRTSNLPPALTILSQTLMGALFGVPGVMLATPLLAASLVAIRMLYVEDVLGDVPDEKGGAAEAAPPREKPKRSVTAR